MSNKTKNFSTKVANATKWSAITNILRKLISPIVNMILARLLTPDIFGIVATINVVISFAELFTDAGFQKYLIQHEFKNDNELYEFANVAFWTNLILSIAIWIIILIFRDNISSLVGSPGYGIHLAISALAIPLLSFSSIQQSIYKRNFNFKALFIPSIINSVIPLITTIPIAYYTGSCWSLIIGTLISKLSDAIFLTIKSKWKPKIYYDLNQLKEMFSFSMWTLFESLSIWLTLNIDIFVLGNLISNHHLGLYKTSLTSVNQITTLITTTIIPVFFSALARNQNNDIQFKNTFHSFQKKCSILLIPMSFGMLIFGDVITWILLGNQWKEATPFISIIGFTQAFTILFSNFASEVYRAKGNPKTSFAVQTIFILITTPIIIIGAKQSFKILCISKVITIFIFFLMHVIVLKFKYKFNIITMFNNIKIPLLASLIMTSFGIILRTLTTSNIIKLVIILICIIIYFLSCMISKEYRNTLFYYLNKLIKKRGKHGKQQSKNYQKY